MAHGVRGKAVLALLCSSKDLAYRDGDAGKWRKGKDSEMQGHEQAGRATLALLCSCRDLA